MEVFIHRRERLIHSLPGLLLFGGCNPHGPRFVAGWAPHPLMTTSWLAVGVQHLAQSADVPPEIVVLGHLSLDLLAAVQHRGVIPAAQGLPDPKERGLRLLAHEVHGDLAREDDLLVAGL